MREQDKKLAEWAGVLGQFACIVNEEDDPQNTCELDSGGRVENCFCAKILHSEDKTKSDCEYWQRVGDAPPLYTTDDASAITLLPILVERKFNYKLESCKFGNVYFQIFSQTWDAVTKFNVKASISEAICSAILQLIESEKTL